MSRKQLPEPTEEAVKDGLYKSKKKCFCELWLSGHPQCGYCHILVGPKHLEPSLAGQLKGKPICGSCRELYRQRPECFEPRYSQDTEKEDGNQTNTIPCLDPNLNLNPRRRTGLSSLPQRRTCTNENG